MRDEWLEKESALWGTPETWPANKKCLQYILSITARGFKSSTTRSAGTITPLHHDLTNNFMAQIHGRKLVKLIPSCDLQNMSNDFHCDTDMDAGAVDLTRFPDFARVRVVDCAIGPGDLLFLPVGWWHYVQGLDISITVTFTNFAFDNDFHSCYTTYHDV